MGSKMEATFGPTKRPTPTEIWVCEEHDYDAEGVSYIGLSLESVIAHYQERGGVGEVTVSQTEDDYAHLTVTYPEHIQHVCTAHTAYYGATRYLLKDLT